MKLRTNEKRRFVFGIIIFGIRFFFGVIGMTLARDATDMLMGGTAAMFATVFTNPIEVVKTRLQLQGEGGARARPYRGVPHGLLLVARAEGLRALQRGLSAMLGFQFCLNTFRLGVFRMCERRGLTRTRDGARTSLARGAAAAGAGGALGSVIGTPFFLVKTRLQAQAAQAISVGHQHKHTGTFEALAAIYAKEGFKGWYRGAQAQAARGAAGSAAQLGAFSAAKDALAARGLLADRPLLRSFAAAGLGGLLMTACLNPFDVVATRLSNQPVDGAGRGRLYSGALACLSGTLRAEGARALCAGAGANYLRLGPHSVLLLVAWDQLKLLQDYFTR